MSLLPGDRIDRYEIVGLLGSGGMGEVYRARDPKLEREVALKILRVDGEPGTGGAPQLLREARAVAALTHPNVLAVYDVGEVAEPEALRGLAYVAMELVPGRSLREVIGDAAVPFERRVGWLVDIANALAAAHDAGVVHRDVKPENVMVRSDGVIKVLDFGVARRTRPAPNPHASPQASSLSTLGSGSVVGTPFYMAPEQLRGLPVDGRADQFAWGVVAYELLTGAPPWVATAGALSVVAEILSDDPTPPHVRDARIGPPLSNTILRALSKDRERRFPSMRALVASVEGESEGAVARSGQATFPRARDVAPPRRRPSALLLAAGGLAVVAAGALAIRSRGALRPSPPAVAVGDAGAAAIAAGGCTSNRECVRAHGGEAWRCHSGRHECVEIASVDCTPHFEPGDLESDDAVWFGGLFPLSTEPDFDVEMRGAELARREFARALGTSAARTDTLHAPPIDLLVCDEGVDAARAARHLTEDVEVPAVLGFGSSKTALATIPIVFLPHDVLSFLTIAQQAGLNAIPETPSAPRLIWRSTLDTADQIAPTSALISDILEPRARAAVPAIADRGIRVAFVRSTGLNGFFEAMFRGLHFNGRSALENGEAFRQFVVEPRDGGADRVVEELVDFAPQVIFDGVPDAFVERILLPLEARWRGKLRPSYILGSDFERGVLSFIGAAPERRRRFFAVTNVSSLMTNAELVLRYNLAFPESAVTRTTAPQPSYDAFYVLADALYSLRDAPVTGPSLSRAIARLLPPGRSIDVGPAGIFDAFQTLRGGGGIDLNGAIGSLDFDPTTGEAPIDYSILCCGVDDRGRGSGSIESGVVFDSKSGKLTGALRCP